MVYIASTLLSLIYVLLALGPIVSILHSVEQHIVASYCYVTDIIWFGHNKTVLFSVELL
jgi:hypothetical protein